MEASVIAELIASVGPGMAIGALGLYFGFRKDQQCNQLMDRIIAIAEGQTTSNVHVASSLDALREAIRLGTGGKP